MALNKTFINPYNFVRYGNTVNRLSASEYDELEKVTGYIDCSLDVAEKLAMPDHESDNNTVTKGKYYDFFKISDMPVIPGSELKGCIRNLYESITYSCFSVINANTLTKRVPMETGKIGMPGIVRYENSEWHLYPARKVKNQTSESVSRKWKASPKEQKKGKKYSNNYYESEFKSESKIDCNSKMDGFIEILEVFLKNNASDKEFCGYIKELKKSIDTHSDFVAFYRFNGMKLAYFSPAQVSRTSFNNTVKTLLTNHSSCTGKKDVYCSGCRLFGTLGEDNPIASKLRFTDAVPFEDTVKISNTPDMLPPLQSPKITSVEFYSLKGERLKNVKSWDYDTSGITLRGRKFYFHSLPKNENSKPLDSLVTGQFKTSCALKGSRFTFKVYFDKISKEDLGKLLWVLALGDNDKNSDFMQKIGAGKPAGYGSVKITVDGIVMRDADNYSITKSSYDDLVAEESIFDPVALADIKRICNYNYLSAANKQLVSYPIGDDSNDKATSIGPLTWFVKNRTAQGTFKQVLPTLTDDADSLTMDSQLPGIDISTGWFKKNNSNKNNGNRNYQDNNKKPQSSIFGDEPVYELKCMICEKTEEVSPDVYRQRKNGGYKCKSCRGKK